MKSITTPSAIMFSLILALAMVMSCDDNGSSSDMAYNPSSQYSAGYMDTFAFGSGVRVLFKLAYVPGGITYPTDLVDGDDDYDDGTATVDNAFWIAETEVTYKLWKKVHAWATSNGYTFANEGTRGGYEAGADEPSSDKHPVTTISWRDATIWCNALTECYNDHKGTGYTCVYYTDFSRTNPSRTVDDAGMSNTPGSPDRPYIKSDATGFRLPSRDEWELAARWRNRSANTVSGYSNPWFIKGDSASGAAFPHYNTTVPTGFSEGTTANDLVAVYYMYYSGTTCILTGVTGTAVVKSKQANSLGLYDMSGNVWEWCGDFYLISGGELCYHAKGGAWNDEVSLLQVGYFNGYSPNGESNNLGFRIARSEIE